ncbi:MAG: hypothetical protein IKK66_09005 [Ruminococcus sp.]|nr:hypothetical protein [Ruminococcus sp.]
MAFQPAVCNNCGGEIQVDDVDMNGFAECMYCRTKHRVIDVITIDGLPTVKTYLINANQAIEDGNFDKAVMFFNKIIEIKPNCHEAYWGLYCCQNAFDSYYGYKDKYGNSGNLTKASIMLDALNKYAYRAIEYAPKEQAVKYKLSIRDTEDFIELVRSGQLDSRERDLKGKQHSGCYIATAVYGSYTCDEVVELRRFRDDYLSKSKIGIGFIRLYYTISPAMIKYIKSDSIIEKGLRKILDYIRFKLN